MKIKVTILKIIFFSLWIPINSWSQERLIFAVDIIRHGDRTPIYKIPKSPSYRWPQGPGQLTPQGMQQAYQLGKKMREKYINKYHLLPPQYDSKAMYVRSSDYDRTLMTATSLLMGLYPLGTGPFITGNQPALPLNFQPIPIHSVSQSGDDLLVPRNNRQQFNKLMKKYVFTSPEWIKKNAQYSSKYAKWSKATGTHIIDLYQVSSIGSSLYIAKLHQAPLPFGLRSNDIDEIIDIGKWAIAARFKPKEIGQVTGRPLLSFVESHFKKAINHKTDLKYVLLSGHDTTILSAMSALGVPLTEPPDYAADLNFSLFEKNPGNYFIRITYNGQPVKIAHCDGSLCTLAQFNSLLH